MSSPFYRPCLGVALFLLGVEWSHADDILSRKIDTAAQRALDAWGAPGVAIAVVRDGKVIHLRGYGVRAMGQKEPVTADTVFPIASCSKAFTSTLLAALTGDGSVNFDDHVRKHLPWFRLSDPLADEDVRLRDLLCHRTGLASHNLLWYRAPWTPEEMVRRAGLLPLDKPFRAAFQYQSTMVTAAGLAAASAGKKPWADLVRERLLVPLEMKSTVFTTKEALALPDLAEPHRLSVHASDGRTVAMAVPRYVMEHPDAAGSVHSSARDLANWLLMHIQKGKFRERVVVTSGPLAQTHHPHIPIRMPSPERELFPDTHMHSYALGWVVYDHGGHRVVGHGGAIQGFRTQLDFLPDDGVGVVVLSNLHGTYMNLALSHTILDLLLDRPRKDWNSYFQKTLSRSMDTARSVSEGRVAGTRPSRELSAYAGDYEHPAYGRAQLTLRDGMLVWRWREFAGAMEHFHYDTFLLLTEPVGPARVTFELDDAGKVALMRVKGPNGAMEFRRARP
jgi:CubicO group peptidase (beta-lactamase class C family)